MLSSVDSPVLQIFPHYLIRGKISEKKFLNIKWVLLVLSSPFSETFLILRKSEIC
jgi:hypothetical protein